jgi:hypothetical protein
MTLSRAGFALKKIKPRVMVNPLVQGQLPIYNPI